MKVFYCNNEGVQKISDYLEVAPPKFEGGPGLISLTPPSNGPKVRDLRVLLGKEFGTRVPLNGTLSKTRAGHPIIIPERQDDQVGAVVFVFCSHWVHRVGERPNLTKGPGWAEVVAWECGYGAWGYGYVALLKMMPGEWHFSTPAGRDWERQGILLSKDSTLSAQRWSKEEFEELTGQKGEPCTTSRS